MRLPFACYALALLLCCEAKQQQLQQHPKGVPRHKLRIFDLLRNRSVCDGPRRSIPKLLFQMFWQTFDLPPKIAANRLKYAHDYEHRIFDNYKFSDFIRTHFIPHVHTEVMKLKGPHRADVFRYAAMYLYGGVYLDIKTEMVMPLRWIFLRNGTTYTSLGDTKGVQSIFQGVLASPPCNPIFLQLIRRFVLAPKPIYSKRYNFSTKQLYTLIAAMVGNMSLEARYYKNKFSVDAVNATVQLQTSSAKHGIAADGRRPRHAGASGIGSVNLQQKEHLLDLLWDARDRPAALSSFDYELFVERDESNDACWDGPDRYNMCSFVHANKASWAAGDGKCAGIPCCGTERVFKTRYADYPAAFNITFKDTI